MSLRLTLLLFLGVKLAASAEEASLRINELLASNRSGALDDTGNTSDWVELHNAGDKMLRLGKFRLWSGGAKPSAWALPNIAIAPGGYQLIWMSGLDRVSLSPEALRTSTATLPFELTLVPSDAKWKYLVPSRRGELADDWTAVDFDDNKFALGQAGFGFGDDDDATQLPVGTGMVLLRHTFQLPEQPLSQSLVLEVDFDDGFVAYLNGTRVAAVNAPRGKPDANSMATKGREAGTADRFDLSAHSNLLRKGKNVLAIAGLNAGRGSSDMSLIAGLGFLPTTLHTNFRLAKKGGEIKLSASDGRVVDSVRYGEQVPDQSYGRAPGGDHKWGFFLMPTPGSLNAGPQQFKPVEPKLKFSPKPGVHGAEIEVRITSEESTAVDIRYTRDGAEPTAKSQRVDGSIQLDKTGLFRAAAFVGEERVGAIKSATYLVGRQPTLPVISISMKPEDFYEVHMRSSATGRGSERTSHMEIFNTKGKRKVSTGFGLRLHGGFSRRGDFKAKKSYRAYFRDVYGLPKLKYNIIPTAGVKDFDKLILRANGNDRAPGGAYIRDQLMRDLHKDMGGLVSNGTWCLLYVNGNNYGVYNLAERMDEEFLASHIGKGEYDIMKTGNTILSGTRDAWEELGRFIGSTDISRKENYELLKKRVDIEDFTDYIILNLWGQNYDWPHNNWYAARKLPEGKWQFMCWDSEWGFRGGPYKPENDSYAFIDSGGAYGFSTQRKMFIALLGNPEYRKYYQAEVYRHLNGALSEENVLRRTRELRDVIAKEIGYEYSANKYDIKVWHREIEEVEEFSRIAGERFRKWTEDYFAFRNKPVSNHGISRLENKAGYRHIVHLDAAGKWIELVAEPNSKDWSICTLPLSPPASGRPALFALKKDERRLVCRGIDGHIYEYASASNSGADGNWKRQNLTEMLGLPKAAADPSVMVANSVPHVVYVDELGEIRELWFDGQWRQFPLPAMPRAEGGIVASLDGSTLRVIYRSMFGVPYEQSLNLESATAKNRSWRTEGVHRLPAKGQPLGLTVNGRRDAVFHVTHDWPRRPPFVFDWNERRRVPGYFTYEGDRNALVYAKEIGQRFKNQYNIPQTADQLGNDFTLLHDTKNNRHYLAFCSSVGGISESVLKGKDWNTTNLSEEVDVPRAKGSPIGWADAKNGTRHYLYQGENSEVYQLSFDGKWTHQVLLPKTLEVE